MAKIINIDKFRDSMSIEIENKSYSLNVLTVAEYVNGDVSENLDSARKQGYKAYCTEALRLLKLRSNIPEAVLNSLTTKQLEAILLAMQGIDPDLLQSISEDNGKK